MKLLKAVRLFFKAVWLFFKDIGLLLLGKKKLLKPSKPSDATILLRRYLDKGLITPSVLSKKLALQSEKDMRRKVRSAVKKGREITVGDLTKTIKEDQGFLELCEDMGLSIAFLEGLAEIAIKEGGKRKRRC